MKDRQPGRRTQAERRAATRDVLLKAARSVFARRGYAGASLDQIATAAGLTKGAIYHQFDTKADLFLALADQQLSIRAAQTGAAATAVAADDAAGAVAALPHDREWSLLFLEFVTHAARDRRVRRRVRARLAEVRGVAARALATLAAEQGWDPSVPPERLAAGFAALGNGLSIDALLGGDDGDEEAAATFALLLGLVLRGLADRG